MDGLDGRWWGSDEVPVQSDRGAGCVPSGVAALRCRCWLQGTLVYYRALQGGGGGKSKNNSAAAA